MRKKAPTVSHASAARSQLDGELCMFAGALLTTAGHRIHWNVDDGRARVYDGEFDGVALRPEVRDKKSATRALERIASAEFDDLRRIILEFANPHAVTMAKYANFEQYAEEAGL